MARILVVDDQQSIRDLLRAALSDDFFGGHDVTPAVDGAAALSLLDVEKFDLLLTNIGMPVMDGVALADTVRARQPRLPVLLVTGRPVERLPLRWQSYYIAKPFHLRHLSDAIAAALADGAAGAGTSPLTRGCDVTNN